jgi:hypothetical protein
VTRGQVLRRADEGPAGERLAGGAVDTGVPERGPFQFSLDQSGQPVPGAVQRGQRPAGGGVAFAAPTSGNA